MIAAFAPFRVRGFRFQWPSDLLASFALEMETLILGWYILVETRSVILLTAFGALQFLGSLVAPFIGVLGDRMGRRKLLCAMRLMFAALASLLMLVGLSGALSPLVVFAVALLSGMLRPSELMIRLAIISDMMPADRLMNAMGLSRITLDVARITGALTGAGLFAWLGLGLSYVFVTCLHLASFALMLGASRGQVPAVQDPREPAPGEGRATVEAMSARSVWRDLKEGLMYVRNTPRVLAIFWLAFLVNLVGFPLSGGLLPYVAKEIYLLNEIGFGHLVAAHAFGALAGSMLLTFSRVIVNASRAMLVATLLWHAALGVFVMADGKVLGMAVLFLVGLFQSVTMVSLSVALLSAAAPQFRARVMGVRMLAVYGLPLGLLASGYLINVAGFSWTIATFSALGMAMTVVIGRYWRHALWH